MEENGARSLRGSEKRRGTMLARLRRRGGTALAWASGWEARASTSAARLRGPRGQLSTRLAGRRRAQLDPLHQVGPPFPPA